MKKVTLANFLKQKRIEKGLYQREFAELLGISRLYYLALETGRKNKPSLKFVKRLSDITSVDVFEILKMCGA